MSRQVVRRSSVGSIPAALANLIVQVMRVGSDGRHVPSLLKGWLRIERNLKLTGSPHASRKCFAGVATDEIGFHAVENRHYVTDIHATVLHQLGLDPRKLEGAGHKRLDIDFGEPIREVNA